MSQSTDQVIKGSRRQARQALDVLDVRIPDLEGIPGTRPEVGDGLVERLLAHLGRYGFGFLLARGEEVKKGGQEEPNRDSHETIVSGRRTSLSEPNYPVETPLRASPSMADA